MSGASARSGVAVDLLALQSETTRARGIGRYTLAWANALEARDPGLVTAYVLDPRLAPPGALGPIAETGKVVWAEDLDLDRIGTWHATSLFDLSTAPTALGPARLIDAGIRLSATVYDLIPALDPERELDDPARRRDYRTRLELCRLADRVLTLSRAVSDQLVRLAEVDRRRVRVVGAAADERFQPPASRALAAEEARRRLGARGLELSPGYVLASSGSHPRKNNEGLLAAFLAVDPALRDRFQLVITGEVDAPTAHHYRSLAALAGAEHALLVPGHVDDATLVALTQGATLACMASFAEGFGLPVAEALACGTPVVCSDRPPFDELVGPGARFDPADLSALKALLERALGDAGFRSTLLGPPPASWRDVASASAEVLRETDATAPRWGRPRSSARRSRPRLAVVTPLPPAPSGAAGYDFALLEALARTEKLDVSVFAEGLGPDTAAPLGCDLYDVEALGKVEAITGAFDHVVYALGNSHHHLGALRWLRTRPGVVLAHDVRLTNLYRHAHGDPWRRPGGLARELAAMYPPGLPEGLGERGELSPEELDRYGALMARDAIRRAQAFLVSSEAARALAVVEAGPGCADRIATLPFAFYSRAHPAPRYVEEPRPAPEGLGTTLAARWGAPPPGRGAAVVAQFGIVDAAKLPDVLLDAAPRLGSAHPVELALVGPVSDERAGALAALAGRLGIADRLTITGPLGADAYRAWLDRADLGVQLRAASNGEASATIGECLAAGLPTIVSDIGWSGELPDDVVWKLPPNATAEQLAALIERALGDAPERAGLARAGAAYAAGASFDRTARALIALLGRMREVRLSA